MHVVVDQRCKLTLHTCQDLDIVDQPLGRQPEDRLGDIAAHEFRFDKVSHARRKRVVLLQGQVHLTRERREGPEPLVAEQLREQSPHSVVAWRGEALTPADALSRVEDDHTADRAYGPLGVDHRFDRFDASLARAQIPVCERLGVQTDNCRAHRIRDRVRSRCRGARG